MEYTYLYERQPAGIRSWGHDTTWFIMKISGIEAVTGSLGQGLSVALGMALGVRLEGLPSRVYCVIGDGEAAVRDRDLDL